MSEKTDVSNYSIVALTLGVLSILIPFVGFILGIAGVIISRKALKGMAKSNQTGRGLAISGLICSIVGIVIHIFIILGFVTFFYMIDTQVSLAF